MAQEEHILGYNYSGGGCGGGGGGSGCSGGVVNSGRSLKKVKQKKVPQRGLGVAQLEKIRLEEQQKKDSLEAANILAKSAIASPSDIPPFLSVQCPKFRPGLPSFYNSVPMPPPSATNLPSPKALYRFASSVPNIEVRHEGSVQMSKQLSSDGGEMASKAISSHGDGSWPRFPNGEYNLAGEKHRFNHHGFAFEAQVNLPYESTPPVLPLPIVPQRSQQFQPPPPALMVNPSSGISRSARLNSPMEPPSNQSSHGDNYTPSWSEEEKMVGVKRPFPFYHESLQAPSSHGTFCPSYVASLSRSDELASLGNGHTARMEPRNLCIREGPSNSNPQPEHNPIKLKRDNGKLSGDFLTLAPPAVASPPLNSKQKHLLDYSDDQGHKLPAYESMLGQEYAKMQSHRPGPSESVEQCFSFFPIRPQTDQTGYGEKGEAIDLNLKL